MKLAKSSTKFCVITAISCLLGIIILLKVRGLVVDALDVVASSELVSSKSTGRPFTVVAFTDASILHDSNVY